VAWLCLICGWIASLLIIKQDKADSNQSKLGKRVLHEFKHKVKTQSNT
jgi:hypothetical protein